MTDAHFHRSTYATFLSLPAREVRFVGLHPWQIAAGEVRDVESEIRADASVGVGEIGLDRLRDRTISAAQRAAFGRLLAVAAACSRPVVLHGAKCWGEVVAVCRPYRGRIPAFLFHGFSRSTGLLPEIYGLNGFVGVGAAVLNDHAVNYRDMVRILPVERLLIETDGADDAPDGVPRASVLGRIYAKVAALRGLEVAELKARMAANAGRFVEALA
ncbi:MAG: TatD family hydrolase [Kiritimatiellia bacterium]